MEVQEGLKDGTDLAGEGGNGRLRWPGGKKPDSGGLRLSAKETGLEAFEHRKVLHSSGSAWELQVG